MSARTKIRGKHRRDRRPMRRPKPPDDGDVYYIHFILQKRRSDQNKTSLSLPVCTHRRRFTTIINCIVLFDIVSYDFIRTSSIDLVLLMLVITCNYGIHALRGHLTPVFFFLSKNIVLRGKEPKRLQL